MDAAEAVRHAEAVTDNPKFIRHKCQQISSNTAHYLCGVVCLIALTNEQLPDCLLVKAMKM